MSLNGILDCIRFDESLPIHPSRLTSFLPKCFFNFSKLNNTVLANKIYFFIQKKCAHKHLTSSTLKDPYCKLLSVSTESWLVMEKFLGALYYTDEIKHVIDGSMRTSLQNFLSQPIYECVLKRGSLYKPTLSKLAAPERNMPILMKIATMGHFALEYLWTQIAEPLQQRFTMQFDLNTTWNFRHVIDPQVQVNLFSLVKKLFQQELEVTVC